MTTKERRMDDHVINGLIILGGWIVALGWCAFVLLKE